MMVKQRENHMTKLPSHSKPLSTPEIRVLVVENDKRTRRSHEINLKRWGYCPIFAEGNGEALLLDAEQKVSDQACHLALVDMRLISDHDRSDKSGLSLIPKLQPALAIVASGSGDDRDTTKLAFHYGAFDFVNKVSELDALKHALGKAAKQMQSGDHGPTVRIKRKLVDQIMNALAPGKPEQVCELLKAMFPEAKLIVAEQISGAARTPSVNLGRESFVLRLQVDELQPFVVKLALLDRTRTEIRNYKQHVRDRLPGRFYGPIELERCCERWHIGGIVYPFNSSKVFTVYYQEATALEICDSLRHLFEQVWIPHYQEHRQKHCDSLYHRYQVRWGDQEWVKSLRLYVANLRNGIALSPRHELIDHHENIARWIQKRTGDFGNDPDQDETIFLGQYDDFYGHGDLQADNFFVDSNGQCWSIDHERAGIGPIFQDFVLLELDIWVHVAQLAGIEDLIQAFSLSISDPVGYGNASQVLGPKNLENEKVCQVVRCLRQLALNDRNSLTSDPRVYYWGLLLNALYRITLLQNKIELLNRQTNRTQSETVELHRLSVEQEKTHLLGAMVTHRLDHWDDGANWPPKHWKINEWQNQATAVLESTRQEYSFYFSEQQRATLSYLITGLNSSYLDQIQEAWSVAENGSVAPGEIEEVLAKFGQYLIELRKNSQAVVSTPIMETLDASIEIINNNRFDILHRLKLSVPLIPLLLTYEVDLELPNRLNFRSTGSWFYDTFLGHIDE